MTGGAGFIGSHLTKMLLDTGWHVVVLDDFSSGKIENFDEWSDSSAIRIVRGDIRDRKIVDEVLDGIDSVVHLAAFVNPPESIKKPLETHDVNLNGTLNVLESCLRNRIKKLVFASSAAVYGDGNPLPLREGCCLRPISPYAASKASAEFYCKMYRDCYGLGSVILRFFNVYGPGQNTGEYAGVITRFVASGLQGKPLTIYGDGSQTRDFVNVKDVVSAVEKALSFESADTEVFNVCTGKPVSINELARFVCETLGKNLEVKHAESRPGDIIYNYGDPTKAQHVLGFETHVNFKDGLEQFIKSLDYRSYNG